LEGMTTRPPRRGTKPGIALCAVLLLGTAGAASALTDQPYPGYESAIYSDPANWLCRGDTDDPCDHDLDATVILANGSTRIERWQPARRPRIDCFYVYPTISTDPEGNSDLVAGEDQEIFVVRQQAARLGSECRLFAPIYRQVTLTALTARLAGQEVTSDPALAYADVVDAWKHYIANDNDGRGVLLIGHSQGAGLLTQLLRDEIDPEPLLRDRLVSAVLLGTSVQVPAGQSVGADFVHLPLCDDRHDVGCIVTYSSFRATAPPPPNSFFGVSRREGWEAACTNPASLGGGRGPLTPYLPTAGRSLPIFPDPGEIPWVDPSLGVEIDTPFVTLPGLLEAGCAERDGFVYLEIDVNGDPGDPRIDDIGGDITPEWGLHLVDANLAMGNLVSLARSQAAAYCARNGGCGDVFRGARRLPRTAGDPPSGAVRLGVRRLPVR